MSARTNYIVAAVAAVAILGAVGGYVYYTQTNAAEFAADEVIAEDTITPVVDVAELDPATEAATVETMAAPDAVTVTAIDDITVSDPTLDVTIEADQPSLEGTATIEAAPVQPE